MTFYPVPGLSWFLQQNPRQCHKLVQHPPTVRPAIQGVSLRQGHNQLITRRHADKLHARPRRRTRRHLI